MAEKIEVIHSPRVKIEGKRGLGTESVLESSVANVYVTKFAPGAATPWHHHGSRTSFGYVVTGNLVMEFGPRGKNAVRMSTGDFFSIPAGLIHRDLNRSRRQTVLATFSVGSGPFSTLVDGPIS
jgi:uncharacterized RmlC-like cupin family protein